MLPGMQGAVVSVGLERPGFLGVREGEELVVQVVKVSICEKGPRLSANVAIPGRNEVEGRGPAQTGLRRRRRVSLLSVPVPIQRH